MISSYTTPADVRCQKIRHHAEHVNFKLGHFIEKIIGTPFDYNYNASSYNRIRKDPSAEQTRRQKCLTKAHSMS